MLPECNLQIVHQGQRAGEIIKNYSNISKSVDMLGWSPQVSLDEGLRSTMDWFLMGQKVTAL